MIGIAITLFQLQLLLPLRSVVLHDASSNLLFQTGSHIVSSNQPGKIIANLSDVATYVRLSDDRKSILIGDGFEFIHLSLPSYRLISTAKISDAWFSKNDLQTYNFDNNNKPGTIGAWITERIGESTILAISASGKYFLARNFQKSPSRQFILQRTKIGFRTSYILPDDIGHDFGVGDMLEFNNLGMFIVLGEHPDSGSYGTFFILHKGKYYRPKHRLYRHGFPIILNNVLYISAIDPKNGQKYVASFKDRAWAISPLNGDDIFLRKGKLYIFNSKYNKINITRYTPAFHNILLPCKDMVRWGATPMQIEP